MNKVNVYLFWGNGCPHCEIAKMFFNKIKNNFDFNLNLLEVWDNPKNEEILNKVSDELGVPADTVPYIVIGDKVFGTINNFEVKEKIKKEINSLANERNNTDIVGKYL